MKWKQTLSKFGLTEETVSHGLRSKFKDYYKIQDAINELENQLNDNSTSEDEIQEIQVDLQELNDALELSDLKLVKAIEVYDKNKDRYAEMSKHLGKGRPRKNPLPNPTPQPQAQTQKAESGTQTQTQTQTPQNIPLTPTEEVPNEEKKKSSVGWLIGAAIIGILTLGAVNAFKNAD
jgi:hypothetical protein